jgi:glycosyltransferase involved in cell wall biosynthesis
VLAQVLAALRALSPRVEVVVVDDGSRDDTVAVVRGLCQREPALRLLQLSRNFGKEAALTAGLAAARGEVVVLMDADGQHPTALLADMLRHWQAGADVVYAVRARAPTSRPCTGAWWGPSTASSTGAAGCASARRGRLPAVDRRVVDALLALPERHRFMKGLYAWVGFPSVALDYEPLPRARAQATSA